MITVMGNSTRIFASFVLLLTTHFVSATTITYGVNNVSGNTWTYSFEVFNDSLSLDLEEFTVFFTLNTYQNLSMVSVPSGWDPLVIQSDPSLPDDGFFDALALSAGGIVPGGSRAGFIVQFDFLGSGIPGNQAFDVVDPTSFVTIDSGITQPTVVPLPAASWLFGSAIIMILGVMKQRKQV